MTISIHPTAIVEPGAELDDGVSIGPYAYIGAEVRLGKHTRVQHHATVDGYTQMGENNDIFPYAFIGGKTHDLKFTGGRPGLKIGNHNVFREYTTIHAATNDGEYTVLGNHNLILAYSHIAHDCIVQNHLIMSSHAALGGHTVVGDHVNVGWGAGIHQFCRVGSYVMIGASTKLVQDAPPFMVIDGQPARAKTINKIGLTRANFQKEEVSLARYLFKTLYVEGLNKSQALEKIQHSGHKDHWMTRVLIQFIVESKRGLV